MNVEDLILVDVDEHVIEPPHLFEGRLPKKYQDKAPRLITRETTGRWRGCTRVRTCRTWP